MVVSIVIVNYRTPYLTIECLQSIASEISELDSLSVWIADNNSCDGSFNIISNAIQHNGWQSWAFVFQLEQNGGFAYGNNRIIEKIFAESNHPDYVWLLNPDTVIKPGACKALVQFLLTHPGVGIAGSYLENREGELQISAFRDHTIFSELLSSLRIGILDRLFLKWKVAALPKNEIACQTDWVSGASMMVRKEVFDQIGLLDENFFMYFEEVDFCLRARRAGWSIWYNPASRVVHLEGAATNGIENNPNAHRKPTYWFESRRRFFLKNHGRLTLFLADFFWIFGYSTLKIRLVFQKKPNREPKNFFRDFIHHSVFFKGFRL